MDLAFFADDTVEVAKKLIGCYFIRKINQEEIIVQITETEAYKGAEDPASHAYRGITTRNQPMFDRAGCLYVYLSYGIHNCMNIVTEQIGVPGAVLIRAAKPIKGIHLIQVFRPGVTDKELLNGPGKLTKGLAITLDFNNYDLLHSDGELQLVSSQAPLPFRQTERIGISKGKEMLWRFIAE
jgi:DNA-3-methyladenine glycosylase